MNTCYPLIFLNNQKKYTLSVAPRSFSDPSGLTDRGAIFVDFLCYLVQGWGQGLTLSFLSALLDSIDTIKGKEDVQ